MAFGGHPEIIAHRGASRERPENTIPAFLRALELGADGVELDVHRLGDGEIVVHHDFLLADGRELSSLPLKVVGGEIPTLTDVVEILGDRMTIYCELKGRGTAEGSVRILARPGVRGAVHAFDHRQIAEARNLAPEIPRGVLEVSYPIDALAALRSVTGRDLWRHRDYIDPALVAATHAAGGRVVAWTVNDEATMRRFAGWGVDALCTDDVALARRLFPRPD